MFEETVTLVLKHGDISANINNDSDSAACGSWSAGKQTTKFYVNLRNLLGTVYDSSDYFVLRLNQLSWGYAAAWNASVNDTSMAINLSGLNFINSTYDVRTGNNTNKCQIALANINSGNAGLNSYAPNTCLCNFKKSTENVELTFELMRIIDDLPVQCTATKIPHMAYSFDIYAVHKEK